MRKITSLLPKTIILKNNDLESSLDEKYEDVEKLKYKF